MDNLSPHKSAQTLGLIQRRGANVLFLPAYSPDLNPIEKMWSKLKEFLRSAQARSEHALIQAIASALAAITPQDAINWFASCGYSFIGSFEQLVGKNDRTSRQIRSWFSGVFACQKPQEFATGCVIRHMMSQLSFNIGTPKREQRATFVVDIVQDQLSWR
jgi:hypothetical protein